MDTAVFGGAEFCPVSFYYLRHGETDWNRQRRCQGHADIPLNQTGRAQAERARDLLVGVRVATICCSPLSRAQETAEIVNAVLGCPIVAIEALKECGMGEVEGAGPGTWYDDWCNGWTPDGGEIYEEFIERALSGVNEALGHPGPVLIVSHGGVYKAAQRRGRFAQEGTVLANAQPVWHQPPTAEVAHWQTRVLD